MPTDTKYILCPRYLPEGSARLGQIPQPFTTPPIFEISAGRYGLWGSFTLYGISQRKASAPSWYGRFVVVWILVSEYAVCFVAVDPDIAFLGHYNVT